MGTTGNGRQLAESLVVFQGGVAANEGVVRAFRELLEREVLVLPRHQVMGALGVALLARDWVGERPTQFKGFDVTRANYRATSFECKACPNLCEIAQIHLDGQVVARWGGRCDRWEGG